MFLVTILFGSLFYVPLVWQFCGFATPSFTGEAMPSRGAWQNKRSHILRMVAGFFLAFVLLRLLLAV